MSAPANPTVVLTVSPNPPIVNQSATFVATAVAAVNHSIVRYEWNFGDGSATSTGMSSTTHTYGALGTFTATVRAVDDVGQAGAASASLVVGSGIVATFYFTPTVVHGGLVIAFNAANSTPSNGASISQYQWDWGDGTPIESTSTASINHTFPAVANTYVVRLVITDSQNRIAVTQQNVPVVVP